VTTHPILDRAAAAHLAEVAADTRTGAHVGIVAPGGYGKTTLLHHLGRAVSASLYSPGPDPATDDVPAVLLVDDAHLLDDADLRHLHHLAATTPVRLVIAARPWPRPPALAALLDLTQDQLVPAPFDQNQVRDALPAQLRTDRIVDFVHAQTGGVPGFVARLARATIAEPEAAGPAEPAMTVEPAGTTGRTRTSGTRTAQAGTTETRTAQTRRTESGTTETGTAGTRTAQAGTARSGTAETGTAEFRTAEARAAQTRLTGTRTFETGTTATGTARAGTTEAGTADTTTAEPEIPRTVLAEFRPELARLDDTVLRFLLAAEAGVGLHLDLLVDLLETDAIHEVVEAARATGLIGTAGQLLPIAQRAVRALVPVERRAWTRQRLAELQLARGGQVLPLMRPLATTGIGGASAARAFEAAAGEALPTDPVLAARLYAAAVTAGRPGVEVGARRAEALALAGDLDGALRLADDVLTTETAPHRKAAAAVAATALAHRGQLARSAQLYRWAGAHHLATVATIGIGDKADQTEPDGPPTSLSSAIDLMARGVQESVTGTPTTALSMLVRAAGMLEPVGRGVLLPDSPAALGAILAVHRGELATATSLLERAAAAGTGGVPLATRHRLLLAWIAMVRGNLTEAKELLRRVPRTLEPRDRLFAVAVELGVARRAGDATALGRAWPQAGEAVLRHPVDLFTFLPLGELTVAAARLRDETRLATHLAEARALLAGLGDPPLWATPLWWGGLHAAIVAGQRDAAEENADALSRAAARDEQLATLAAAARCWVGLVDGRIDPDAVEDAARGLHGAGFTWDAARLAGRAATKTSDRAAMVRLLDCARMVQGKPVTARRVSTSDVPVGAAAAVDMPAEVSLSERELQVAELVVSGMTYRDVGDRLFISAKTVEHHVARMRQRLGATSRSELLSQLRTLVGSSVARD
jgi:DNA-binding CsgD family transcriptional regulator